LKTEKKCNFVKDFIGTKTEMLLDNNCISFKEIINFIESLKNKGYPFSVTKKTLLLSVVIILMKEEIIKLEW
jgi:hypothetical protein